MSDISELFSRDPLSLTTEDIDKLIYHYREARQRHLLGESTKPTKAAKKEKAPPVNLTLDDLGL